MRKISGRRFAAAFVLAALLVAAACAVNPVTGRKEIMLISESAEVEMGKSTDQSIRAQFGLYDDPELTAYVDRVARRMAPFLHRPKLVYHFAVLDTPVENAFAAPGGYVYVTRGLLAMMNSEAELATVLGHELGHVNARHSARQMSSQLLLLGGVVLGSALSEDVAKVAPYMLVGLQVLFLKFSRGDEYQADSLGILYSRQARYSAAQMIPFFASIQKLEERAGGGLRLPNFLSTHPLTARRIEEAKALLEPGDAQLEVKRGEMLARVDGLVYGEDPRQGYVDGNAFYHPEMRFALAIPAGWTTQNTPRQVVLVSKDEKAAVILTAEASSKEPAAYLQDRLKAFSDSRVSELASGARRINGLAAFHGAYQVSPKPAADGQAPMGKNMAVSLDCIRKDGMIYTLMGTAAEVDSPAYESIFERTAGSFRRLEEPARLAVQPGRLSVRAATRTAPLREILAGMKVPEKKWPTIEFLNSIALQETVEKGRILKIAL